MPRRIVKVVLATRSTDIEDAVRGALAKRAEVSVQVFTRQPHTSPNAYQDGDILIVDADLDDKNDLETLRTVAEARGASRPTIATGVTADLAIVRLMMRLGVSDFLPQPVTPQDVNTAVSIAIDRLPALDREGAALVSFIKPAGGMGATTILTHVAFALAQQRSPQTRTCILDLALQTGDVALHLDFNPTVGVMECIDRFNELDQELLGGATYRHTSGVDAILAAPSLTPLDRHPPAAIEKLLDVARERYDVLLVDMPPVWTEWTPVVLQRSQTIVLVVQNTVTALRLARRMLDALTELGIEKEQILLAGNRFDESFLRQGIGRKDAAQALGRDLDLVVPSEFRLISEAINAGVSVSQIRSGTKFEKATKQLAKIVSSATLDAVEA